MFTSAITTVLSNFPMRTPFRPVCSGSGPSVHLHVGSRVDAALERCRADSSERLDAPCRQHSRPIDVTNIGPCM